MECQNCHEGELVVLSTKGWTHPHRERSILTNPQKYLKKVPCDQCNGTGENLKEDLKETCDGIANVIQLYQGLIERVVFKTNTCVEYFQNREYHLVD